MQAAGYFSFVFSFKITKNNCLQYFRNLNTKVHLGKSASQDVLLKICACFQRGHKKMELFHNVLNIVLLVRNLKQNGIFLLNYKWQQ